MYNGFTEAPSKDGGMDVTITCPLCGKTKDFHFSPEEYKRLIDFREHKALAQDTLYQLSIDDREMFVSGICSECWDSFFAEEEEP